MIKIGDPTIISTYNNVFAKGYAPNWSENVSVIKEVNTILYHEYWNAQQSILYLGHMLVVILTVKELLKCFMKKNCKKTRKKIKQSLR